MIFLFIWIIICLCVAYYADGTTLGFWPGFLLSLILTPVIGFIIALCYPSKESKLWQQQMMNQILSNQQQQQQPPALQGSVSDELLKLEDLKGKGLVTEEEYKRLRANVLKKYM